MNFAKFATVIVALLCVFPARAELVDAQRFQSYLNSPTHHGLVHRALALMNKAIVPGCDDLGGRAVNTHPLTAITFGPDGVPNAGAWKSEIPIQGCGNDTVLNLFFVVEPDGVKIRTVSGVPGWTRAHPDLQNTATRFAALAAWSGMEGCRQALITNTKLSDTPLPEFPGKPVNPAYRPWAEIWSVTACENKRDVLLSFFPSPTGTQISSAGVTDAPVKNTGH